MPYKLYYFAIRGRAEPIRTLFIDNGIAFDDTQFLKNDEWWAMKNNFTFGQVPCLKDGDFEIPQSSAILRHVARKHGLEGDTEEEKTFVDFFAEGVKDLHNKYTKMIYNEYEKKDEFISTIYPVDLGRLEKLLKMHKDGQAFVLGDKLSYADYVLFEELDIALILSSTSLDGFPTLKAYHERFAARPNLKDYFSSRKLAVNNNGRQ